MSPLFYFMAAVTLVGALAAMGLRNPVHCALSLVGTFAGLAGLYLGLGAQFLGLAQVLVYIGAVAILIIFVLMVTSTGDSAGPTASPPDGWRTALPIALLVGVVLAAGILRGTRTFPPRESPPPIPSVRELGESLMTDYVVPLQVVGVLLTAGLIGAAIIALRERPGAAVPGKGPSS